MSECGGSAVFSCPFPSSRIIVDIKWILNDESWINVTIDSSVSVNTSLSMRAGRLTLQNLTMDFNGLRIQCVATFDSGPPEVSSKAVLLIQGNNPACIATRVFLQPMIHSRLS